MFDLTSGNKISNNRVSDFTINPLILNRWSPRSMSEGLIDDSTLMSLFESARWAPSSSNSQPWRFIYATREIKALGKIFGLA